jgi:L-asparaginase
MEIRMMGRGFYRNIVRFSFIIILITLVIGLTPLLQAADLPLIAVVTTGGTIAEKIDAKTGAVVPAISGYDLMESVPGIKNIARLQVLQLCNIDSSQMTPDIMLKLSHKVKDLVNDPKFSGVIITHGTDTMEETSFFLDLVLPSDKPVIFVGAQHNASDPAPDGPSNIANAVIQAVSADALDLGVTINMNQYICAARDVRKTHTDNLMTFMSMDSGYIGYVDFDRFRLFRRPLRQVHIPMPQKDSQLPDVFLFTMYAGADGKYIRKAVDDGVDGIVIAGFGLGNVNASVYEAIRYARGKNVPVVISSRCYNGRTYPVYGGPGGGKTLELEDVIFSGGHIPSKARILLMLALTTTKDIDQLKSFFQ